MCGACDRVGHPQWLPGPAHLFTAIVQLEADRAVVMLRDDEQIVANHS
jgi:hypothetical protein